MSTQQMREACLFNEIETSVKLLKKGMGELQRIDAANDFYHLPILLLSNGFERLLKCLISLAKMNSSGNFESGPFNYTHNLDELLQELIQICKLKGYRKKFLTVKEDISFLSNDTKMRNIISVLSRFAQCGRYYNLDLISTGKSKYGDPEVEWESIHEAILGVDPQNFSSSIRDENQKLLIHLERFARALARLFIHGNFGNLSISLSPLVSDFYSLRDSQLGKTNY